MATTDWKRGTQPGTGLRRSNRTKSVNCDLPDEVFQLWSALAIHHKRDLNDVAPWAIRLLAEQGVKVGKRPPDMGAGLKKPKQRFQSTNKYAKEERDLWKSLKPAHGGSWASVLTAALVELYWREPVPCTLGNLPPVPRRLKDDDAGPEGMAA